MPQPSTKANGNESGEPVYVEPEPSREIPVLAYRGPKQTDDDKDGEGPPSCDPPEFAMIEVNGTLLAPVEFPEEEACRRVFGEDKRVELGKLYRKGPEKTPTMILGSHELKGEVVKLDVPFCLMEKKYDDSVTPKRIEAYQIIGIVKEKFLFKNYPKVIMR